MDKKIAARSTKRTLAVEVKLECISKVTVKIFHPATKNYRCFKSTDIDDLSQNSSHAKIFCLLHQESLNLVRQSLGAKLISIKFDCTLLDQHLAL